MNVIVSVIIPVKCINNYIYEALEYYTKQDCTDFEVIIFPDVDVPTLEDKYLNDDRFRVIPTGKIGPAEKRDLALKYAKGEILAFIDDDAYPRSDWISNIITNFGMDDFIGAVGGPQLTPVNDPFWAKISGLVLANIWASWKESRRYKIGKNKEIVDDMPSVNLAIRKEDFAKIGGFDSNYYPGEDSKLCRDIQYQLNKKIVYDPKVVVFHHRRPTILKHLLQIYKYALHRGNFMKTIPENSRKITYLIPMFFVLYLVGSILLSVLWPIYILVFMSMMFVYFGIIISTFVLYTKKIEEVFAGTILLFLTHLVYGFGIIVGLSINKV